MDAVLAIKGRLEQIADEMMQPFSVQPLIRLSRRPTTQAMVFTTALRVKP